MCCSKVIIWRIIALISMLFSCMMIILAIGGILTYHCTFNPDLSKFQMDNFYFIYPVYFYNNKCVDTSSDYIVWNPDPSSRTWGWAIAYLVINAFWFFSSLLLFNATNYWKSSTGLFLTYPWLFLTFIVLCTDVAASVMYGLDYQSLETLPKLFDFVGITYPQRDALSETFVYIPLTSAIMIAAFSKIIVGWFITFFSFIIIFILLVKVGKNEALYLETRPPIDYYYNSGATNPAFEMAEIQPADGNYEFPRNGRISFEDIPLGSLPHRFIPRPTLFSEEDMSEVHFERPMQLRIPQPSDYNWDQEYRNNNKPQSPKSILKSPQNQRVPTDNFSQRPWTYLSSSSQPSSMEDEASRSKYNANMNQAYYY